MRKNFSDFLSELFDNPIQLIDKAIDTQAYISLDLSVTNSNLKKEFIETSDQFQNYIDTYLTANTARVAYGGYNEERSIYKRSTHFNQDDVEERNIHLGLDLWISAETEVYASLDGVVYGFADNAGLGNYGPTIILKHTIKSETFYTLYGHLSRESLVHLKVGKSYKKGDVIATLGTAEVNGDYPPHLHFQIIKNIGEWTSDYPGVCRQSERAEYLSNCPDPNLLLKIGS